MTAHHENFSSVIETPSSSNRAFGVVFSIFFLIIGVWPIMKGVNPHFWCILVSSLFLLAAFIYPRCLQPLNKLWTRFGFILQKIITPLILGVLYLFIVIPFAIILRFQKKDLLSRRFNANLHTYWIHYQSRGPASKTMKDQF